MRRYDKLFEGRISNDRVWPVIPTGGDYEIMYDDVDRLFGYVFDLVSLPQDSIDFVKYYFIVALSYWKITFGRDSLSSILHDELLCVIGSSRSEIPSAMSAKTGFTAYTYDVRGNKVDKIFGQPQGSLDDYLIRARRGLLNLYGSFGSSHWDSLIGALDEKGILQRILGVRTVTEISHVPNPSIKGSNKEKSDSARMYSISSSRVLFESLKSGLGRVNIATRADVNEIMQGNYNKRHLELLIGIIYDVAFIGMCLEAVAESYTEDIEDRVSERGIKINSDIVGYPSLVRGTLFARLPKIIDWLNACGSTEDAQMIVLVCSLYAALLITHDSDTEGFVPYGPDQVYFEVGSALSLHAKLLLHNLFDDVIIDHNKFSSVCDLFFNLDSNTLGSVKLILGDVIAEFQKAARRILDCENYENVLRTDFSSYDVIIDYNPIATFYNGKV